MLVNLLPVASAQFASSISAVQTRTCCSLHIRKRGPRAHPHSRHLSQLGCTLDLIVPCFSFKQGTARFSRAQCTKARLSRVLTGCFFSWAGLCAITSVLPGLHGRATVKSKTKRSDSTVVDWTIATAVVPEQPTESDSCTADMTCMSYYTLRYLSSRSSHQQPVTYVLNR